MVLAEKDKAEMEDYIQQHSLDMKGTQVGGSYSTRSLSPNLGPLMGSYFPFGMFPAPV